MQLLSDAAVLFFSPIVATTQNGQNLVCANLHSVSDMMGMKYEPVHENS
jgi:hypothetical protein